MDVEIGEGEEDGVWVQVGANPVGVMEAVCVPVGETAAIGDVEGLSRSYGHTVYRDGSYTDRQSDS